MNLLQSMRIFCIVAERRSFTAAADELNIAHSAISKHVAQLEQRLSVRLLNRTSRHVSLTEQGEIYLRQSQLVLDSIEDMENHLRDSEAQPSGVLRISAPPWMVNSEFAAVLANYRERYPEVRLEVDLDLVELGSSKGHSNLDIALRVTHSPEPGMEARHITTITFRLVATPDFLDRQGRPGGPADLNGWPLLHYSATPATSVTFRTGESVTFTPIMRSSSVVVLQYAALIGMGPVFLPAAMTERDVAEGRLEYVLPIETSTPINLYAFCPLRPFMPARVAAFLKMLEAAYAKD